MGETGCFIKEGLSFGALVCALKTSPILTAEAKPVNRRSKLA